MVKTSSFVEFHDLSKSIKYLYLEGEFKGSYSLLTIEELNAKTSKQSIIDIICRNPQSQVPKEILERSELKMINHNRYYFSDYKGQTEYNFFEGKLFSQEQITKNRMIKKVASKEEIINIIYPESNKSFNAVQVGQSNRIMENNNDEVNTFFADIDKRLGIAPSKLGTLNMEPRVLKKPRQKANNQDEVNSFFANIDRRLGIDPKIPDASNLDPRVFAGQKEIIDDQDEVNAFFKEIDRKLGL